MSRITAFRASKLSRVGLAALVATIGLVAVPTAAFADNITDKSPCGPPQSPASGTAHAKITTCTIEFYEDIANGINGAEVSFRLLDSLHDGVCAKAVVTSSLKSQTFTECHGVAQPYSMDIDGYVPSVKITLSYGGHSPVSRTFTDPFPDRG